MKHVAIITARGGSKRIKKKNIGIFCGKPIIEYSIEAALESKVFDEVMVSTDDEEIKEISLKCGAKVPFMRSAKNSDDYATTVDVLVEVIGEYRKCGKTFDYMTCIYPTAPFVNSEKLKMGIKEMKQQDADSLFSVVEYSFPPQRSLKIENGLLKMCNETLYQLRSQDFEKIYHDCGQFYMFKTEKFIKEKKIIMNKTIPFVVPELEVQDIDTMQDWKLAEMKYKFMKSGEH